MCACVRVLYRRPKGQVEAHLQREPEDHHHKLLIEPHDLRV